MQGVKLVQSWIRLTARDLPEKAKQERWSIVTREEFQRILLDNAAGDLWTKVLLSPVHTAESKKLLRKAHDMGKQVMSGELNIEHLKTNSMKWRER